MTHPCSVRRGRRPIIRLGPRSRHPAPGSPASRKPFATRPARAGLGCRRTALSPGRGVLNTDLVPIAQRKGDPKIFKTDETPRRQTTIEKLAKLKAVYPDGVCTAGNSSTESDGAAVVVLMSESKATALGIAPLAYFKSCAIASTDPTLTYPAVPMSVEKALSKADITIDQIDLIEIQEAFAVQALADARLMGIQPEDMQKKVNVNGSGISLGHPIAATGTMRLVTLVHEMERRDARFGLETICGGGGQGICAIVERR